MAESELSGLGRYHWQGQDEKQVLFSKELKPQSVPDAGQASFYGIKLDLSAIRKEVKSVQEYAADQEIAGKEVSEWQQQLEKLGEEKKRNWP